MNIEPRPRYQRFTGLSCYTANLASYLDGELPDAVGHLARSVRLAVRVDLPSGLLAFSHHRYPLDAMPDASRLRYTTMPPRAALVGLADELSRRGRVLVLTDSSRLPWSPSRHGGAVAPHWLLVTGRRADSWHVVDAFAGLLPGGEQRPFAGWLSTARLTDTLRLRERWEVEQHTRNSLAFGFPVPVPDPAGPVWLRRESTVDGPAELPGAWLTKDDVLPFLAGYFIDSEHAARHLDDLWTAAGHRVFRYRWLGAQHDVPEPIRQRYLAAATAWAQLPRTLRFAVDSARRGRARPALLRQAFTHLQQVDATEDRLLAAPGREAR